MSENSYIQPSKWICLLLLCPLRVEMFVETGFATHHHVCASSTASTRFKVMYLMKLNSLSFKKLSTCLPRCNCGEEPLLSAFPGRVP